MGIVISLRRKIQLDPNSDGLMSVTMSDAVRPPIVYRKILLPMEDDLWINSECIQNLVWIVT